MSSPDPVAPLIAWYAQGTLDLEETRQVESHLGSCADCRALLALAREAGEAFAEAGSEALLEHVQSQLLAAFADDPGELEADAERWVRTHLAMCPLCQDALEAYRNAMRESGGTREATPGTRGPSHGFLASLWTGMASTVLRPVPALAYLVVLVAVCVPLLRGARDAAPEGGSVLAVPPAIPVEGDLRFRGTEGASPLEIPRSPAGVALLAVNAELVARELFHDDATYTIELLDGETVVWSEIRRGTQLGPDGGLPLLIRPGELIAGRSYALRLVYARAGDPLDGREIFRRSIRVGQDTSPAR